MIVNLGTTTAALSTTTTKSATTTFNNNRVTRLNFINRTELSKIPPIAIFQKNMLLEFNQPSIAWRVIRNCGEGDYHTFNFSPDYYLDTSDIRGFHSCKVPAQLGQVYELANRESGEILDRKGFLTNTSVLEFENNSEEKLIDANIYKDGKLVARYPKVIPGKKATFAFTNNIWIGAVEQAVEGERLKPTSIAQVDTEIELEGVASTDIVMTLDRTSKRFRFHLENTLMHSDLIPDQATF